MSLAQKTVLAIDDTPSILTFLRVTLEAEDAEFHSATSAADGLEKCKELKPDLVILDLGLPDRDGLDVLLDIKNPEIVESPPAVIVLSVRKNREAIETAKKRGADDYITKPFMVDDLLEVAEIVMNGKDK